MIEHGAIYFDRPDCTPTAEELIHIKKYLRNPIQASDIFVFNIRLCDNKVDRDHERFSISAIKQLEALYVGKSGIITVGSSTSYPRIFETWTNTDKDIEVAAGDHENLCELWGKAFLARNWINSDAIAAIQSKRFNRVSISCSIKQAVCSICGRENCKHKKGFIYGGREASVVLLDPQDVYEWTILESENKRPLKAKVRKKKALKGECTCSDCEDKDARLESWTDVLNVNRKEPVTEVCGHRHKSHNEALMTELQEIVDQLEWCHYQCEAGPLSMNKSFVRLKEIANSGIHAKLDRDIWKACHMCDSAFTNPELNTNNDLSYYSIGECEKGYRMLIRSGGGKPVDVLVERWTEGIGWQLVGFYRPRYCPNCGRPLTDEAWTELERKVGENDNHEPLKLEELKQMNFSIDMPVFVKLIGGHWPGTVGCNTGYCEIDFVENRVDIYTIGWDCPARLNTEDYGKTWIAYRRKPKEEK